MLSLREVPNGYENMVKLYGSLEEAESRLKRFYFPFDMKLSYAPETIVKSAFMHELIGDVVIEALLDFYYSVGEKRFQRNNWNVWGGCFNQRAQRKSKKMSTHSWGIAIDVNPHLGEFGKASQQPIELVLAFKKRGFIWGGDWGYPDGMHFQAVGQY